MSPFSVTETDVVEGSVKGPGDPLVTEKCHRSVSQKHGGNGGREAVEEAEAQ